MNKVNNINLNQLAALVVLASIIIAALINASKIAKHKVEATLSTWLIFLAGTSTSFLSYLISSHKAFLPGVLNGADVIGDLIVIFSIVFFGVTRWKIKPFEKYYLIGLVIIGLFWFFSSDAFYANLLIQILLTLAYAHTIIKLKRNTESFLVWGLILFASVASLYPTYNACQSSGNILALIYSVRSVILISFLIVIMFIFKPWSKRITS